MIRKSDAIKSLRPGAQWILRGDDLEWLDQNQSKPTEAEITAEIARLQAAYDAQEYARNRVAEYPSIGDQLDALWKGGDDAAEMLAKVQAVKNKYPKPE
jgi:hypothetical protein